MKNAERRARTLRIRSFFLANPIFVLSEIEKKFEIPTTTLSHVVNGKRDTLKEKYIIQLEIFISKYRNVSSKTFYSVYEINNITKGLRYIGQTDNWEKRIRAHKNQLISNKHKCKQLQSDFNNGDVFEYNILSSHPSRREALIIESSLINGQSYNIRNRQ